VRPLHHIAAFTHRLSGAPDRYIADDPAPVVERTGLGDLEAGLARAMVCMS
jgi:hypothetical protein